MAIPTVAVRTRGYTEAHTERYGKRALWKEGMTQPAAASSHNFDPTTYRASMSIRLRQ